MVWFLILYIALTDPRQAMTKVVIKPYHSFYECMTLELKLRSQFRFVCERST